MEPRGSLPHSQQPTTCSYPEPHQSKPTHPPFLILLCYLQIGLPSCHFPSGFSTNILYACALPIHASCPSHLVLDVITQCSVSSKSHEADYYAVSYSTLLLFLSYAQISFLTLYSEQGIWVWDWWSAKLCLSPPLLLHTVCVSSLWKFQWVDICFVLSCRVICPLLKESTTSPFRVVCQSPFLVNTDVVLLKHWCSSSSFCSILYMMPLLCLLYLSSKSAGLL